ncbi:MAG: hypothetical protein QM775_25720 [Pirellulales bacterium]
MTTDERTDPLQRICLEEAIERLHRNVTRNQFEIEDIVCALSGLGKKEVRFNIKLVLGDPNEGHRQWKK